jgi:hypothetical protein
MQACPTAWLFLCAALCGLASNAIGKTAPDLVSTCAAFFDARHSQ